MVGVDSSCSFSTNHGIDKTGQLAWMLVTDLLNPIPTFCLFVLNFDPLSSTTFVSLAGSVMTTNDPVIMRLSSNVLTEHSLCFCVFHTISTVPWIHLATGTKSRAEITNLF